jgi:alpha-tubulin suppressor-like RCC1 family protein
VRRCRCRDHEWRRLVRVLARVLTDSAFTQITVGGAHSWALTAGGTTCAVALGGIGYCWGSRYVGSLGNGQTQSAGVNRPVTNIGGAFRGGDAARPHRAGVGSSHGCAIKTDGSVRCWGDAYYGQTGDR